jgi:hypothetical protein
LATRPIVAVCQAAVNDLEGERSIDGLAGPALALAQAT